MTDIITTISTAITLATRLKKASDHVKEAEFQSLLADLQIELAQAKAQVAGLINENTDLKQQIRNASPSDGGDPCPKCRKRTWRPLWSRPDAVFGVAGGSRRFYQCSSCGFNEERVV